MLWCAPHKEESRLWVDQLDWSGRSGDRQRSVERKRSIHFGKVTNKNKSTINMYGMCKQMEAHMISHPIVYRSRDPSADHSRPRTV